MTPLLGNSWQPQYKTVTYMGDSVFDITNLPSGYAGYTRDKQVFHIIGDNESGYTDYDLQGLINWVEGGQNITSSNNNNNNAPSYFSSVKSGLQMQAGALPKILIGAAGIAALTYFAVK